MKIVVLVNKNWETEGVMSSLVSAGLSPKELPFPDEMYFPNHNEKTQKPRAVFFFQEKGEMTLEVKIFCIQDLMYYQIPEDPSTQSSSSSEEKYRVLPELLKKEDPDFVISISTAGYPGNISRNGSVVIGANFFIHDGHAQEPFNPKSNLKHSDIGKLLKSNVNPRFFDLISNEFRNYVEPKFIATPRNPGKYPCCIASEVFTALSNINVTEYEEYNWVDEEGTEHYHQAIEKYPCRSAETTHGVVKLCTDKPVIFMSPVTDQFGCFDFEVTPSQNFTASFNAGIVLGKLLCDINSFVKKGNKF